MVRGVHLDPERLEVRLLLQRAPIRGARILEIGSGDGRSARRFAHYAHSLVGIDPDAAQIERAKEVLNAGEQVEPSPSMRTGGEARQEAYFQERIRGGRSSN